MTRRRIVVGVLFGGVSAEHEVSWRSARNVVAALDPVRYLAFPILIDRQGRWLRLEQGDLASDPFQSGRGKEIPRSGGQFCLTRLRADSAFSIADRAGSWRLWT
jgi:D-alanine-D-alanine ligase